MADTFLIAGSVWRADLVDAGVQESLLQGVSPCSADRYVGDVPTLELDADPAFLHSHSEVRRRDHLPRCTGSRRRWEAGQQGGPRSYGVGHTNHALDMS